MAVTSIWSVKGWLGKVVIYIENPNKTTNPACFQKADVTDGQIHGLSDVIAYAASPDKTTAALHDEHLEIMHQFVSGINCMPATAREEMLAVKRRFGKEEGVVAYHGYQSFAPGEADPRTAHEIGMKLAARLWGDHYQVVVATHLDKENHLHNHFVVNTVSFVDGIKYHRTKKDYHDMQTTSDDLCREYGLSVIENPQRGKSRQYGEWRAEQEQRPTWRGLIRTDIDEAIRQSMTERQFFENLRKNGYEVKIGKDISVRPPGKERFVRLMRNFGEDYSMEEIRRRILRQTSPGLPSSFPLPEKPAVRCRFKGDFNATRKITGFRALYFYYCYKLGIFPKERPQNRARLHFLLREDLLKLNNISQEVRLLVRNRIDKALFEKQWESIIGNCDEFLYLGGNEQSTHKYVSELLGKSTIDTNTYGRSFGHNGNYSTNYQISGRELLTADEVRMLDNRQALLFIRGERPIRDAKYDILRHPNVALTPDGGGKPYLHGSTENAVATLELHRVPASDMPEPEQTETVYELLSNEEMEAIFLND